MDIIHLDENNGLCKFAKQMVKSGFDMYLDFRTATVSIYVHEFAEGFNVERFQIKVAGYIGSHMLNDSYKIINVYTF